MGGPPIPSGDNLHMEVYRLSQPVAGMARGHSTGQGAQAVAGARLNRSEPVAGPTLGGNRPSAASGRLGPPTIDLTAGPKIGDDARVMREGQRWQRVEVEELDRIDLIADREGI